MILLIIAILVICAVCAAVADKIINTRKYKKE